MSYQITYIKGPHGTGKSKLARILTDATPGAVTIESDEALNMTSPAAFRKEAGNAEVTHFYVVGTTEDLTGEVGRRIQEVRDAEEPPIIHHIHLGPLPTAGLATTLDESGKAFVISTALSVLSEAFKADPAAMHALVCNRVPCNPELADHPTIQVEETPVYDPTFDTTHCSVGLLGIINGILEPITGQKISTVWKNIDAQNGRPEMTGFSRYTPPLATRTRA